MSRSRIQLAIPVPFTATAYDLMTPSQRECSLMSPLLHGTKMIDDSQDLESIARMLRQEREHLIDAWELLESEQRQLALSPTTTNPTSPPADEKRPVVEQASPNHASPNHASPTPPREDGKLPPPPAVVRTVRAANAASASNTFRFLQREFDKPDEERSP